MERMIIDMDEVMERYNGGNDELVPGKLWERT